jgi:NADH:ubiquinone oxidoreductase subunit 4 (subunit M)
MEIVLNVAIWLPLVGAVIIGLTPAASERASRWIAILVTGVTLLLALVLTVSFVPNVGQPSL